MNKLLSGRYLLTVICGLTFAWAALNKILSAEAITTILTMVFVSYFDRSDRKTENGNGGK